MELNISKDIIIPLVTSIGGVFTGILFRMYWERRINKALKQDELIVNDQFTNLKDRLIIYWKIYFKLLVCLSTKTQINKITAETRRLHNITEIETDIIMNNLDEIIVLITQNIHNMEVNNTMLEMILRFISHVLAYKCIRRLSIVGHPSEYGYPFPDDFTNEISRRTFKYQKKYDKLFGNPESFTFNFISNYDNQKDDKEKDTETSINQDTNNDEKIDLMEIKKQLEKVSSARLTEDNLTTHNQLSRINLDFDDKYDNDNYSKYQY